MFLFSYNVIIFECIYFSDQVMNSLYFDVLANSQSIKLSLPKTVSVLKRNERSIEDHNFI